MIHTYLDLSTDHLAQETMRQLNELTAGDRLQLGWPAMTVAPYEYGAFVTVPDPNHVPLAQYGNTPTDLAAVLHYAQRLGIHLLRFDSDGDEIDNLPTHDW